MKILVRLIDYAKNFKVEFSAAGFFILDKGVILSLISNVTTYVIILIQLSDSSE